MIVDKFHDIISFGRSNWFGKQNRFITENGITQYKILDRTSEKYSKSHFIERHWKTLQ